MIKIAALALIAAALFGQTPSKLTATQRNLYLGVACPGKVNAKGECTACLGSGQPGITELKEAIPGSFTGPGQKEVLLLTGSTGCDPHADNFGGAILLMFRNGVWAKGTYEAGLTGTGFQPVQMADGRQLLVYQGGFGQMGEASVWTNVLTISNFGAFGKQTLLRLTSGFGMFCEPEAEVIHNGEFKNVELGKGSIRVHVLVTTLRKKGDKNKACDEVPGSSKKADYEVEYLLRGDKFVVAPASAAAEQILKRLFVQ
jgi:hypothetical protein